MFGSERLLQFLEWTDQKRRSAGGKVTGDRFSSQKIEARGYELPRNLLQPD